MAVTIVSAKVKVAGGGFIPFGNAKAEVVKISGTIANADTGTYSPEAEPVLDAAGKPILIGIPHGISSTFTGGVITHTCNLAAGFTSLDVKVLILCKK